MFLAKHKFFHVSFVKTKRCLSLWIQGQFKRVSEEKSPDKEWFYRSVKDGKTCDDAEKLESVISDEDYLGCKIIWNEFNMKNMGYYHNHYLKKDVLLLADVFEMFIEMLKILQTRFLSLF